MQPQHGENHGRDRLGSAQKPGFHRSAVIDSLQIQHIRRAGADNDDRRKDKEEPGRELDGDDPRLHNGRENRSSEQHGEPRDHHRAPFGKHLNRPQRIQGQRDSRHHAPEAPLLGQRQSGKITLRGDQNEPRHGEHEPQHLAGIGKSAFAQARPQHDEHQTQLLDGGAHASARVMDDAEIAYLA